MKAEHCQSCGMPMGATDEMYGANADGSKSKDYCGYCFENGTFTNKDCTMGEMVEYCVPHVTSHVSGMSGDEARKMLLEFLPTLKRWKA